MKTLKNTKSSKIDKLFNLYLIFIICQPFFDVGSNLHNYGYSIFSFITYIKPLFVFSILLYIIMFIKLKSKKRLFIYYVILGLYIVLHSSLLYYIFTDISIIAHEIRFIINIIYFVTIFITLKELYNCYEDKEKFKDKLKKTLIITIVIYCGLYLASIITNTSRLTYEFSDAYKKGSRGWYYSGQIFGHLLSIVLPAFTLWIFKSKKNIIIKIILLILITIPMLLLGTKVPYFILIIVSSLYILINFIYKIINRKYKIKIIEILCCLAIICFALVYYKQSPVYENITINNSVSGTISQEEDLKDYSNKIEEVVKKNEEKIKDKGGNNTFKIGNREKIAYDYERWTKNSLNKLNELYNTNKLHSSDNRNRQLYFMHYKFLESNITFKLLGLGYLNQPNYLSMERDIIMPLYSFGIIGFVLFTSCLWLLLFKTIIVLIKNIKKLDLETIILAESFCMFFCISVYAGYTYIYTQFGIVLAIIMVLLHIKIKNLQKISSNAKILNEITEESLENVQNLLEQRLKENKKLFVITANPETITLAKNDSEMKEMLMNKANLKVPDGIAIVKVCQNYDMNIKRRITGCDLTYDLLKMANKNKKTVYLYGAKEEVIKKVVAKIEKEYKNIKVIGYHHGYEKDQEQIKKEIIKLKPDICLVALGIPKQEVFINGVFKEVNKGIYMGVGGTFDVLSGMKKRAPKIFIKLNLEWLYRISTEPKRIKRFIKNDITFILKNLI